MLALDLALTTKALNSSVFFPLQGMMVGLQITLLSADNEVLLWLPTDLAFMVIPDNLKKIGNCSYL